MTPEDLAPLWIETPAEAARVCSRARRASWIAIDTEADSLHSYFHKLCLVQLSFDGEHALFDPLALGREGMAPVAELLGEPSRPTLMHGADYDIRVLDRDLGARVRGLRDTQSAAQLLGEKQTGLAALVGQELGVVLDKRYQRADWGHRPLPAEHQAYAAGDTAFLHDLSVRLEARLRELGRVAWWEEECRRMEEIRWEEPEPDPRAFERVKGAKRLRGAARDRFAALHAWREEVAAERDVPTFRVLRNDVLLTLAEDPPETLRALAEVKGMNRPGVRHWGSRLLALVKHPPSAPPPVQSTRWQVDRELEARVRRLRSVRDEAAQELGLEPGILAPRATLQAVAERMPADRAGLEGCLDRRWRTDVLAERIFPVVNELRGLSEGAVDAEP